MKKSLKKKNGTELKKKSWKFRSGFERVIFEKFLKKIERAEYEQVSIDYILENKYWPDWYLPDHGFYIEIKGRLTSHDRRKHMAVKRQHPELDIRFVFMQNNPICTGSQTRYSDWCEKNGFQYAIKEVPKKWIQS